MPTTYDAIIIGAGPAGATTAFLLAEAGWSVAIIEKKLFPRGKVCGEFISATSLPLLQKLNLEKYYYQYGGPEIRRAGLFVQDTIIIAPMPHIAQSSGHWGRALERKYLDNALLEKAGNAGAKQWQPWEATKVEPKGGLYICTIMSNNKIKILSARIVIMANGSWEKNLQNIRTFRHRPSDLLAFKRHFIDCDLPPDLMPLLAFPGGYGGLVQSAKNQVTLSGCIRRDILQNLRIKNPGLSAGESFFKHIETTCLGVNKIFRPAVQADKWFAAGPIRPGIRSCYKNGIFFVGNIAGEAHPIIAEGISMAMQSAWLLSKNLLLHQNKLHSEKTLPMIGKKYTKQWHSYFSKRIHVAAFFAQLAMRPKITNIILPMLKRFPSIITIGANWSGKTKAIRFPPE